MRPPARTLPGSNLSGLSATFFYLMHPTRAPLPHGRGSDGPSARLKIRAGFPSPISGEGVGGEGGFHQGTLEGTPVHADERGMRRIGIGLWAAAWTFLFLYKEGQPNSLFSLQMMGMMAGISGLASFGRVAERAYVGGAIWPFLFPRYAFILVFATLCAGTVLQSLVWGIHLLRNIRDAGDRRRERSEAWLHDPDDDPWFSRDGLPLNQAAWQQLTPHDFEAEVLELFRAHGFRGELTPGSGDEGIDLELWKEGRRSIAQCKRYRLPVGQPALRDFVGAMRGAGVDTGYFVTTSAFTEPALRWVEALDDLTLVLVDGHSLVRWARDRIIPE
jgi:hypothetical protein